MSRRGWLLFAAMGVIWGIPYLLIRVAVREISPATLVFLRTAAAGLLLLPLFARRDTLAALAARWRPIIVYTVAELAIPWLLLFRAEQRLSSSLAGLLVAAVPLVALLIGHVSGHEAFGGRRLIGLVVGFAGVAAVVGIDVRGADLIAVGEIGIVAIGYAVGPFVVARYLGGVPAIGVVGASLLLTALLYAPYGLTHLPTNLGSEEIVSVVLLVLVCTALAFPLFFQLIAEVGPSRSTVITYVNPAVAVLLGIVLLGESFSIGLAVGFPLILLGSYLGTGVDDQSVSADVPPALRRGHAGA